MQVHNLKYGLSGDVKFGRYLRDQIAIIIENDGERIAVATVNLEGWGALDPPEGHCWIKTWSENEGIDLALERAGVVELTKSTLLGGYGNSCKAVLAKLTPAALTELAEQKKNDNH